MPLQPPPPIDPIGGSWVEKRLTQCAEEWQEWVGQQNQDKYLPWSEENLAINTRLTTDAIVAFYAQKNIGIENIELSNLPPEGHCLACNCLSDQVLRIQTQQSDYFIAQGFLTQEQLQHINIQFGDARQVSDTYQISSYSALSSSVTFSIFHGGGCKDHEYMLVADNQFEESVPPQIDMRVIHNANGDTCELGMQKELTFDLSPLRKKFVDAYPGSEQLIVNVLDDQNNQYAQFTMEFY